MSRIGRIKYRHVAIITPIEELESDIAVGKVHLIDATNHTATNDHNDNKYDPSRIVVLSLIKFQRNIRGVLEWYVSHAMVMTSHKANMMQCSSKHHDSTDQYYSYDNKANFGIIDMSSISQCSEKQRSLKIKFRIYIWMS